MSDWLAFGKCFVVPSERASAADAVLVLLSFATGIRVTFPFREERREPPGLPRSGCGGDDAAGVSGRGEGWLAWSTPTLYPNRNPRLSAYLAIPSALPVPTAAIPTYPSGLTRYAASRASPASPAFAVHGIPWSGSPRRAHIVLTSTPASP